MMILSEPTVTDLIEKIKFAIKRHKTGNIINPIEMHDKIKNMYNWRDVAKRTELVYNGIQSNKNEAKSLIDKIHK
jgi:phosphatidylinositol glycan class A protein